MWPDPPPGPAPAGSPASIADGPAWLHPPRVAPWCPAAAHRPAPERRGPSASSTWTPRCPRPHGGQGRRGASETTPAARPAPSVSRLGLRQGAPEKRLRRLGTPVQLLPAGEPRRHHEISRANREQGAERLPGRGVVAQLELDLSQHRPGRARGRVGGHHPLRHLARFHESVAGHERAGQHLGGGAVVRGPEPERAPRVTFGVSQIGLARGESPALQEEPGQLASSRAESESRWSRRR